MPHYLIRWRMSEASVKGLIHSPQDRTERARALTNDFGGKLLHYFFALGEFDGLVIAEFPNNEAVVAAAIAATSTGGFSAWETTALLTSQEAKSAMQMAHDAKLTYKAPNA